MKQPRVIQRLSSLLLATLLLFTAVSGQAGLTHERTLLIQKRAAEQAKSGKATDSHSSETQLSAAQFEAVVMPAITLDGGSQTAFLLPAPTLVILLLLSVPCFGTLHFRISIFLTSNTSLGIILPQMRPNVAMLTPKA